MCFSDKKQKYTKINLFYVSKHRMCFSDVNLQTILDLLQYVSKHRMCFSDLVSGKVDATDLEKFPNIVCAFLTRKESSSTETKNWVSKHRMCFSDKNSMDLNFSNEDSFQTSYVLF